MGDDPLNFWSIFTLLLAPFAGSFLALVVDRWPRGETVVRGRSACRACRTTLNWVDLVPLVSWLRLGGKCRHCGAAIGIEPLLIEVAAVGLAVWALSLNGGWAGPAGALLAWGLLALAWIDAKHFLLPDILTLPLIAAGLAVTALFVPERLVWHLIGAGVAYGAFRALDFAYIRFRGRQGLGAGDAKLLAVSGAWLGLDALPSVVLIGAVAALAWTLIHRARKPEALRLDDKLPFGLYLALATWIVWTFGPLMLA